MAEQWFYVTGGQSKGPIERKALERLAKDGVIERSTLVWKDGMPEWVEARKVEGLLPYVPPGAPAPPPAAPAPPPVSAAPPAPVAAPVTYAAAPAPAPAAPAPAAHAPASGGGGWIGGLGAKISEVADLPTLGAIPVRDILMGGLQKETRLEDIEETFIVGTKDTTPPLARTPAGWPIPRVFWRLLGGTLAVYFLMRLGVTMFNNPNFVPGMIVVGSFIVPFCVVVLFFELNTPRNVSVYQTAKMLFLGGAMSLVLTVMLFEFVPGTGTGSLIPALLTGVTEETGKGLALLLIASNLRYPWQLNGLLFGGAVGAGFAGFESAGYAWRQTSIAAGLDNIMLRAILAPGGHVIWTAMVASAIWKVKGDKKFELNMLTHPIVLRRWGIAVVLHGIWDTTPLVDYRIWYGVLCVVGWYIVLAIVRQAIEEVDQARREATSIIQV